MAKGWKHPKQNSPRIWKSISNVNFDAEHCNIRPFRESKMINHTKATRWKKARWARLRWSKNAVAKKARLKQERIEKSVSISIEPSHVFTPRRTRLDLQLILYRNANSHI